MTTSPYRVLVCDLRSDRLLDVLPLQEVTVEDYIGKAGSLQGTVPIPNRATADRVRPILIPARTALWVERDREIWWGGVLWSVNPKSDERGRISVEVQAGTFDTYLDHRQLRTTHRAKGVDQLDIARDLVDDAQTQPGGDIGITYDTELSGIKRDRTFSASDQPKVRELLDKLAGADRGFEWRIRCYRDRVSGARVKLLDLGYPRLMRGGDDVVLTHPGHVLTYEFPADGTTVANVWQARGASDNRNQAAASKPLLSELLVAEEDLAAGWPRLDGSSDHSSVDDPKVLAEHARAEANLARRPQVIPEITVHLDEQISPDLLGRFVRIRIRDDWHPDGLDVRHRVVGISVTPPERGRSESAKLTLETPYGDSPQ
ncbi:hypothetical protein [Streptomyces nigrescens]|uniref:hypothetical protein n=1 Tax=Streptomyces nigrescens TaxID=1920 RepID=UPI002258FAEA|nr:hypothetical protein [Streptomyces libani]MCX5446010.1 hypothetical protein [Streptomyces libani]